MSWKPAILVAGLCLVCVARVRGADAPPPATPSPGTGEVLSDYVVGIEDELEIVVWDEPVLTRKVRVRPDGKITIPLINDVFVVGRTTTQIREEITERLSKFVRDPSVTVIVNQINSFRVYFLGEINGAGARQFYRPTRLLQAIATAGGLTQFAKKEITLIRDSQGVEKRIPIDYKQLIAGDPAQENIYLQPGDMLLFH